MVISGFEVGWFGLFWYLSCFGFDLICLALWFGCFVLFSFRLVCFCLLWVWFAVDLIGWGVGLFVCFVDWYFGL